MEEYKIKHLDNGNILLEKVVMNTNKEPTNNNKDLDNYFNIFNNNKKLYYLIEIIFNKKVNILYYEDLKLNNILGNISIFDKLCNLSDNEKKYIIMKFDDLGFDLTKELLNTLLTRNLLYELNNIFNSSNSGSGYLKDEYIELILSEIDLSLIIDIRNVHIVKYYEHHLIDSEYYNINVFAKMVTRGFFVPQIYITKDVYIARFLTYNLPINNIPIDMLTEDLCYLYLQKKSYDSHIIDEIPEQFRTEKIYKLYIQLFGKKGLGCIPKNLVDNIVNDDLCKLSIKYKN